MVVVVLDAAIYRLVVTELVESRVLNDRSETCGVQQLIVMLLHFGVIALEGSLLVHRLRVLLQVTATGEVAALLLLMLLVLVLDLIERDHLVRLLFQVLARGGRIDHQVVEFL